MAGSFTLADNARVRYATGSIMYFAQGIPQGLLAIAIPVWLASQGVGAGDIGSYLAVIVLPWAFKLVTGPLMDRYEFLPMGRRRPWAIGAQLGLSLSLLALMLVERPAEQVGLLMIIGVLINSFAATQDVAVDGMSIDLTPVREQGRLNAFMSFGKSIGWASTAAVSGMLLTTWGLSATAIIAAAVTTIALIVMLVVREREGERTLPWADGKAASVHRANTSFRAVFSEINKVLWVRSSLIVMAIMFFDGLIYGYGQALMPIAAVNLFGYTTPQWSQLVAMMGLIGAVLALTLGPAIDKMGAKRMLLLAVALLGLHAILIAQTQHLWQNTLYVRAMLSIWVMMLPVVMVASIALAMAICKSINSATQFAIYMSVANLGHSAGSKIYGTVAEKSTYVQSYTMLSALIVAMIIVLLFHRHHHPGEQGTEPGGKRRESRRHTIGIGGNEAGIFWSGAMRCPKCRADMEQISYEGTEVDRCRICNGIWFDAGEIDLIKNKKAAAAIDTGDAKTGKQSNAIDSYQCPRCSGAMVKVVDPRQTHIWYETCGSCHGSYLDAGELRDLSNVAISDFFRGLAVPERK
ncbi:MAG: MFS transporter [Gammaproteobacteria bacterium]|jgi:PAT family beta-lactamase induction signal transducer AmpG|nr:MFS transporter [Gammaproteobacteria bacterium]MDH3750152.1 MFS transporter [Gammaproteobacteria bacterium]MDH3803899.1 MFS transporter [Gammaproteobacteria bacterium]